MPSRDPHHSAHYEPSRSRALHQSGRAGGWWFVWPRRAELLRGCARGGLSGHVHRGELLGTTAFVGPNAAVRFRPLRGVGPSEDSAMLSATGALPGKTSMGGQTYTIPRMHDRVGFAECRSSL